MLRCGLLAVSVLVFGRLFLDHFPIVPDLSVWYFSSGLFALAVLVALAAYGFFTSLAGRPLFREELLSLSAS